MEINKNFHELISIDDFRKSFHKRLARQAKGKEEIREFHELSLDLFPSDSLNK